MGPVAAEAVPALIQELKHENRDIGRSAVRALGEIGPDAKGAVLPLSRP